MILFILIVIALGVLIDITETLLYISFDYKKTNIGVILQFSGIIIIIIAIISFIILYASLLL